MASADQERLDPETLALLRRVLEEAWEALAPEKREQSLKSEVASRLLRFANCGVRDPANLRMAAMTETEEGQRDDELPLKAAFGISGGATLRASA
jgi:hypothetical protein